MNTPMKRGALIGCGFFAENHLHAWSGMQDTEITALCDVDETRLEAMANRFGIEKRYLSAQEMIAQESLDFVDIATTVGSHRGLVEICAPHVATVICQKPFAETIADAQAMVDHCLALGTNLIIHENFRWQRAFQEMKEMVDAGKIGTPHFARFSFRHSYDNYVNQPYLAEIERFAIMDVGLHLFDLARHFMGNVALLSCATQRLNCAVRGEDSFTALLQHDSGVTSICDCSFSSHYAPEPFPRTAALVEGDQGTLELDREFGITLHRDGVREHSNAEPDVPIWGQKPWHTTQQSVISFQQHAAAVMHGKAQPQPSGADNLQTLKLALAAYQSTARGETIDMRSWREDRP